jgi:hypothetical protein
MTFVAAFKVAEDLQRIWRKERGPEDARAREKADPYKLADYDKKADRPYKVEVYHGYRWSMSDDFINILRPLVRAFSLCDSTVFPPFR